MDREASAEFPFVVRDLRRAYSPRLIRAFHTFLGSFFPIPDEMDPCEVWLENMTPDPAQSVPMFGLAVFDPAAPPDPAADVPAEDVPGRLVAGALFEYYRLSNAALLSYICVADAYKCRGISRALIRRMFEGLQREASKAAALPPSPAPASPDVRQRALRRISRLSEAEAPPEVWQDAVECLQPEDVRWAAEESADGAAPFFAVFAETNALGVEDGVMDAGVRHGVLHRLGFRLLDFDFVQPPLSEGQAPCYDLLLLALASPAVPRVDGQGAPGSNASVVCGPVEDCCSVMPRWQLQLFLFDYALSTHLAVGFRALDYWRYMSASVPPTLPLQPPPWTRRSVAPSPRSR